MDDLWFPDPSDPQGVAWLLGMLYSRRYPQWSKIVRIVEERMHGKTGFEGTIEGLRALVIGSEEGLEWEF
jgi:hypothetical protein